MHGRISLFIFSFFVILHVRDISATLDAVSCFYELNYASTSKQQLSIKQSHKNVACLQFPLDIFRNQPGNAISITFPRFQTS